MQVSSSSGVTRAHVSCSLWTTHDDSVLHKSMCLLLSRSMTMLKPVITGGASCSQLSPPPPQTDNSNNITIHVYRQEHSLAPTVQT